MIYYEVILDDALYYQMSELLLAVSVIVRLTKQPAAFQTRGHDRPARNEDGQTGFGGAPRHLLIKVD